MSPFLVEDEFAYTPNRKETPLNRGSALASPLLKRHQTLFAFPASLGCNIKHYWRKCMLAGGEPRREGCRFKSNLDYRGRPCLGKQSKLLFFSASCLTSNDRLRVTRLPLPCAWQLWSSTTYMLMASVLVGLRLLFFISFSAPSASPSCKHRDKRNWIQ